MRLHTEPLIGKGFRSAPFTATEQAVLGSLVRITLADGREILAQVWGQADSTLLGSRRSTAFFAVANGQAYVFHVDPKRPLEPSTGRAVTSYGSILGRVFVTPVELNRHSSLEQAS